MPTNRSRVPRLDTDHYLVAAQTGGRPRRIKVAEHRFRLSRHPLRLQPRLQLLDSLRFLLWIPSAAEAAYRKSSGFDCPNFDRRVRRPGHLGHSHVRRHHERHCGVGSAAAHEDGCGHRDLPAGIVPAGDEPEQAAKTAVAAFCRHGSFDQGQRPDNRGPRISHRDARPCKAHSHSRPGSLCSPPPAKRQRPQTPPSI